MVYIVVVLLVSSNPPSFLFDAIPVGSLNRRIAGLLLWGHVAVSYAINSQALCSSLNRIWFHDSRGRLQWAFLTLVLAVSSYLVANGIPFFKDLVALTGAISTVPLTLSLPPILYEHWWLQRPHESVFVALDRNSQRWSTLLLLYSVVFLGIGTAGSLASVIQDWDHEKQPPFSCGPS